MSLRPEISGFSLVKMCNLFGSGNEKVIGAIKSKIEEEAAKMTELWGKEREAIEFQKQGFSILERAIKEGVPFHDLEYENETYASVADKLAKYNQKLYLTDSVNWKMDAFWDFESLCSSEMHERTQNSLLHLINGRPIFASRIESSWNYYAYLKNSEVNELKSSLLALQEAKPSLSDKGFLSGFVGELIGWLCEITEQNLDLWFYTS